MALNFAKAGNEVFGFDTDSSIKPPELTMTSCIPPLLKEVDVTFNMLPSGLIVRDLINEFVCAFSAKSTWIDRSTIDVKTAKEVCESLHKKDIFMLDAPL